MSHTGQSAGNDPDAAKDRPSSGAPDGPSAAHRAAAIAALVLFSASVAALVAGIVRGLPGVIVPVIAGVVSVGAGWKALTRRGTRRWLYLALCVLGVVVAVVGLLWWTSEFPAVLLAAVLAAGGGWIASYALRWIHRPEVELVGRARHPVLIVNPRSGDGTAERTGLVAAARARGIQVLELGPDDDLAALARAAVRGSTDVVGMAGGDGSLAVVAEQAIRVGIPFVCIPAGTRNHFAMDIGLDRNDPVGALDAFAEAATRRVDVARVGEQMFLNNVSIGAYGEIVASPDYRENKVSVTLATIPELIGPDSTPLDLRFVDDSGEKHETALVIHVSNNAYDLGPGLGFGGRESLVDGCLGVVAAVNDGPEATPRLLEWATDRFTVDSGDPIPAGIDGEADEITPPAQFVVVPGALRLRIPRSVEGISPSAKRPSLTVRTWRQLTAVARGVTPTDEPPRTGRGASTG